MNEQRHKILSNQDWETYAQHNPHITPLDLQHLRLTCYRDIEQLRGRPLLVYAAKMENTMPGAPIQIDLSDIDGFTDLISSCNGDKGVDVLIHSPGGLPDATERIVAILRNAFDEVHFLVPHSAYSAATMLALSGNSITIHPSGTLGPIDPQVNGTPARAIIQGFERIRDYILKTGPEALPAYIPMIEKYSIDLLEQCADFEILSKNLVKTWIREYMMPDPVAYSDQQVEDVATYFSNYGEHKIHSRPLMVKKLTPFGLPIANSTGELTPLLWEAYQLINIFFRGTPFVKLYENTKGVSWGRQHMQFVFNQPQQQPQLPAIP